MPEGHTETNDNPEPSAERRHRPVLRLAVFDLANRAFVSTRFDTPTLFRDHETPVTDTMPYLRYVETYHRRHRIYDLPALKVMGRVSSPDEEVVSFAVKPVHEGQIKFRQFALKRYDLEDFHAYVKKENENGNGSLDMQLIDNAFNEIKELGNFRAS